MTKQRNLFLLILVTFSILLNSCGGPDPMDSSIAASTGPSSPAELGLAGTFYVVAYKGDTTKTYQSHKLVGGITGDTDWTQACSVNTADFGTAAADVTCLVEAHELDLYFNGASLSVNLPAGYCDYMVQEPYYYFKTLPGIGPPTPAYFTTGSPPCSFDHSASEGPNCCTGKYISAPSATTGEVKSGSYGGKYENCLDGPTYATDNKDENGNPKYSIQDTTAAGFTTLLKLSSPLSRSANSNASVANYFSPPEHTHVSSGLAATDLFGYTTAPIAFDKQIDNSDIAHIKTYRPNPYYAYTCYDQNQEVKARIRIMIREWNINSELHQGGNPDVGGTEANGSPINDWLDWKDFGDISNTLFPE
ncbi:MAG: hypothetical protein WA160_02510 [Pseudobdellovibrio sp.]